MTFAVSLLLSQGGCYDHMVVYFVYSGTCEIQHLSFSTFCDHCRVPDKEWSFQDGEVDVNQTQHFSDDRH
jgi:hypothetical protein